METSFGSGSLTANTHVANLNSNAKRTDHFNLGFGIKGPESETRASWYGLLSVQGMASDLTQTNTLQMSGHAVGITIGRTFKRIKVWGGWSIGSWYLSECDHQEFGDPNALCAPAEADFHAPELGAALILFQGKNFELNINTRYQVLFSSELAEFDYPKDGTWRYHTLGLQMVGYLVPERSHIYCANDYTSPCRSQTHVGIVASRAVVEAMLHMLVSIARH